MIKQKILISPPFLYLVIQKTVLAAINSNFVVDIKCTVLVFQNIDQILQNKRLYFEKYLTLLLYLKLERNDKSIHNKEVLMDFKAFFLKKARIKYFKRS